MSLEDIENIIFRDKKNKEIEEIMELQKLQKLHESRFNSFFKYDIYDYPLLTSGKIRKRKPIIGSMIIGENFIIQ